MKMRAFLVSIGLLAFCSIILGVQRVESDGGIRAQLWRRSTSERAVPDNFFQHHKSPIVLVVDGLWLPPAELGNNPMTVNYFAAILRTGRNISQMRAAIESFNWSGNLSATPAAELRAVPRGRPRKEGDK